MFAQAGAVCCTVSNCDGAVQGNGRGAGVNRQVICSQRRAYKRLLFCSDCLTMPT